MMPATSVGRLLRSYFASALSLLALGCGSDGTGPSDDGTVAFVGLIGVPESGRFFVGQSVPLQANTYDRDHHLITGVPLVWASSDTSVAAVESWGSGVVVFGRSAGGVRITATSQGKSAVAELTVVLVPITSVQVTPAGAAAYIGMKTQLAATATDSLGGTPEGRPVTWTSSDRSKATVSATGEVTALGAGTVTITATIDGKSGTATLTILPRPTEDWSAVTDEWVTYQGNAAHTGYVPARLDPVTFSQLWETAVETEAGLNPVTVGDGRIFVSTNTYFGIQRLHAVDAGTGAIQWSYNFGGIHSVDPPAFADGSVYVTTGGHEDSFVWGFDAAAGSIRFRTAYGNQWSRWYAPVVIGQTLYTAGGYYGGMYAFSTTDGSERWFRELNQYDLFTPAVRDGLVYAYTGDYSPKVTVADAATGAVAYEIPDPGFGWNGWSMDVAPVLGASNNLLATQNGRLVSFDLQNRRIGWEVTGGFSGQPTLANGVVYAFKSQSIEARQESDGSLLWLWVPPDGSLQGTMIATRNLLFVSSASATYALDLEARTQAWSYPAAGHLALSKEGLLLIAQGNGKLTAIKVKG